MLLIRITEVKYWSFSLLYYCHSIFFCIKGITAGNHHFALKCRPVITLDGIVVSSVENKTLEKSLLGHYTNISSCELDCCQKRNCDLVLFDGKLCYGAFCSPENTCHFQSAKGEQISYRAVFMNNIFKGKRCVKLNVQRLTAIWLVLSQSLSWAVLLMNNFPSFLFPRKSYPTCDCKQFADYFTSIKWHRFKQKLQRVNFFESPK